jgi:hypothetical protein
VQRCERRRGLDACLDVGVDEYRSRQLAAVHHPVHHDGRWRQRIRKGRAGIEAQRREVVRRRASTVEAVQLDR